MVHAKASQESSRRPGRSSARCFGRSHFLRVITVIAFSTVLSPLAETLSAQRLPAPPAPSPAPLPPVFELIPSTGAIPNGYGTYALFLICNPRWLGRKNTGLLDLYLQFKEFGRTIGDGNVAVWFLKSEGIADDSSIAENTDVERSVRYCQAWKLKPSEGPHLVVTSLHPDESHLAQGLPENNAVYKLGEMSPKAISDLLAKLTDNLDSGSPVNTPADSPAFWVRILDATQRTLKGFGCAWSFEIGAGPVKAKLHPCQTQ